MLSCESVRPSWSPKIYQVALDRLGVEARQAGIHRRPAALLRGATELGIGAVRIDRRGDTGDVNTLAALTGSLTDPA